jgi:hypothetical protein
MAAIWEMLAPQPWISNSRCVGTRALREGRIVPPLCTTMLRTRGTGS